MPDESSLWKWTKVGAKILYELTPVADAQHLYEGLRDGNYGEAAFSAFSLATTLVPVGKIAKLGKLAKIAKEAQAVEKAAKEAQALERAAREAQALGKAANEAKALSRAEHTAQAVRKRQNAAKAAKEVNKLNKRQNPAIKPENQYAKPSPPRARTRRVNVFHAKAAAERARIAAEKRVAKEQAAKHAHDPKSSYAHLEDPPNVKAGKDSTAAQKEAMLKENRRRNGGRVKSDDPNDFHTRLSKPKKSERGVTPKSDEWQIDHIIPKDKGGTNSYSNLRIISRKLNRVKSNK